MKTWFLLVFSLISSGLFAQSETVVLDNSMFNEQDEILIAFMDGWVFKQGNDLSWADPAFSASDWQSLKLSKLTMEYSDENGRLEGWFRLRFEIDETLSQIPLAISWGMWVASDIHIDGIHVDSYGTTGSDRSSFNEYNPKLKYPTPLQLAPGIHTLAIHLVWYEDFFMPRDYRVNEKNLQSVVKITSDGYTHYLNTQRRSTLLYSGFWIAAMGMFVLLFWFLSFQNPKEYAFRLISIYATILFAVIVTSSISDIYETSFFYEKIYVIINGTSAGMYVINLMIIEWVLTKRISRISYIILVLIIPTSIYAHLSDISWPFAFVNSSLWFYFIYLIYKYWKKMSTSQWVVVMAMVLTILIGLIYLSLHKLMSAESFRDYTYVLRSIFTFSSPVLLLVYIALRFKEILNEVKEKAMSLVELSAEKEKILADQNVYLEHQVAERTSELRQSFKDLKATQAQLIHSEKMASLGELTAGIAHEIQNPLNFVNNFSEVSSEMVDEMNEELSKKDIEEVSAIAEHLKQNLEKINHHGKRASEIVKSMLQHSRSGSGDKELIDINALCDEYLRLAYHGLRARDKSFNADFKLVDAPNLPQVMAVPQDLGRVLLNIINNAFQAVKGTTAKPEVTVTTVNKGDKVLISIKDNGPGIPSEMKEKIFQPFFTTKPTGEGTGLGLSMSYEIINKGHNGRIEVKSSINEGTEFIITLPIES